MISNLFQIDIMLKSDWTLQDNNNNIELYKEQNCNYSWKFLDSQQQALDTRVNYKRHSFLKRRNERSVLYFVILLFYTLLL